MKLMETRNETSARQKPPLNLARDPCFGDSFTISLFYTSRTGLIIIVFNWEVTGR